jgi:hypothetical protein
MYCKICGNDNIGINLLSINICKECVNEISETSVYEEKYDLYKNCIRIFLGYYISDKRELNPVN